MDEDGDDIEDEPEPRWESPPERLLTEFRDLESATALAVIVVDDGFDAESIRIASAWQQSIHRWCRPSAACPDELATPRAWAWLVSGWSLDVESIAVAAGVSVHVASDKLARLVGNRLIYPDGKPSKWLLAAMTKVVAERLKTDKKKAPKKKPGPAGDDDGSTSEA